VQLRSHVGPADPSHGSIEDVTDASSAGKPAVGVHSLWREDGPPKYILGCNNRTELKNAEKAVQQVHGQDLESKKQRCLKELKAGELNLKRFFGVAD
jgi:hypothetical protein